MELFSKSDNKSADLPAMKNQDFLKWLRKMVEKSGSK